jgi:sugar phosphate isomerase/epimerase
VGEFDGDDVHPGGSVRPAPTVHDDGVFQCGLTRERMQYGAQLYSLRSLSRDERVSTVAAAGFDGVELVGLDPVDSGTLSVVAAHVGLDELESDPEGIVEQCRANGTGTVVVPIVDTAAFAAGTVEETAARLDALAGRVADAGGRLLYHNHEFEFEVGIENESGGDAEQSAGTGETPYHTLVAATTRLWFELDVGWATAAGADPVALVDRFGDRVPILHLKDVRLDREAPRGARPVDLGEGDVDLRGCLRAGRRAGVEWIVFEHDAPIDPTASVRDAADWLDIESSGPR